MHGRIMTFRTDRHGSALHVGASVLRAHLFVYFTHLESLTMVGSKVCHQLRNDIGMLREGRKRKKKEWTL